MQKTLSIAVLFATVNVIVFSLLDHLPISGAYLALPVLATPLTAGALLSLAQNEKRSYRYIPKLVVGAVVFSVLLIFFFKLYFVVSEAPRAKPQLADFNPFTDRDELFGHLAIMVLTCFGGLIGIAIRGSSLVLKQRIAKK